MPGFVFDMGKVASDGLDAVNNACNKANDPMEAIRETVVSSLDILADMIADSMVGQYWSDFWDLNVDSVNAIEGMLEDPCNFFGVLGAGCRGMEKTLFGVHKGVSSVLGHYFIAAPQKATENAVSSVSDWWNDKNTYEKIRTVVEAYIMYRMIASGRSKGETVTLELEEAAGAIDGVDSDFSGTLRDLQGEPVPNFQGGYYDRLTEMKQSYKSLNKIKKGLEGSLKNPNLSSVDKEILQKGLDKTNAYIQKIEELFRPFGGI